MRVSRKDPLKRPPETADLPCTPFKRCRNIPPNAFVPDRWSDAEHSRRDAILVRALPLLEPLGSVEAMLEFITAATPWLDCRYASVKPRRVPALLSREPWIETLLQRCSEDNSWRPIRLIRTLQKPPHDPVAVIDFTPSQETYTGFLKDSLDMTMQTFQYHLPFIRRFIIRNIGTPIWAPRKRTLPCDPNDTYELGTPKYLFKLFPTQVYFRYCSESRHVYTRQILDSLSHCWGLYFTCQEQFGKELGSADLQMALQARDYAFLE